MTEYHIGMAPEYLDWVVRYLTEVGAIGRIDRVYTVRIDLKWAPGQTVTLKLRGGTDYNEAVKRLEEAVSLTDPMSSRYDYYILGWKMVQPCWEKKYFTQHCFLCEYQETFLRMTADRVPTDRAPGPWD